VRTLLLEKRDIHENKVVFIYVKTWLNFFSVVGQHITACNQPAFILFRMASFVFACDTWHITLKIK
jgi:hypothetical protein